MLPDFNLYFKDIVIKTVLYWHIQINGTGLYQQNKKPTEWEEILAKDMSNKGLISKVLEEIIQLNIKKKKRNN